jgi:hypothetical protein
MSLLKKVFGSNKPRTTQASLLTGSQQAQLRQQNELNQQYMGGTYGVLAGLGADAQSAYTPISDQYYQDVIANPYLAQQDAAWQNVQGKASLGGNLHSSSLARQKAMFDTDTATNLLQQKGQLFEQERQAEMQGQENAYARQLQALNSMSGLFGQGLGVSSENIVSPGNQGLLGQLTQIGSTSYALGKGGSELKGFLGSF